MTDKPLGLAGVRANIEYSLAQEAKYAQLYRQALEQTTHWIILQKQLEAK
jgi:hypothetical protein